MTRRPKVCIINNLLLNLNPNGLPQDEPEGGAQPSLTSVGHGNTREILPWSF